MTRKRQYTKAVSFPVSVRMHQQIKEICNKYHWTQAELFRHLINKEYKEMKK